MTLAEYLKQYRDTNRVSQRELADILATSPAKISRIECGENIRLSKELLSKMADLNPNIDFSAVELPKPKKTTLSAKQLLEPDPFSFYQHVLDLRFREVNEPSAAEIKKANQLFIKSLESISEQITSVLQYEKIRNYKMFTQFGFPLHAMEGNGKMWAFDLLFDIDAFAEKDLPAVIYQARVRALERCSRFFNKISLVLKAERKYIEAIYKALALSVPYDMPCDFSILLYSEETEKIVYEYNIVHHYDGAGLFDLCVPDKCKKAQEDFLSWITFVEQNYYEARDCDVFGNKSNYFSSISPMSK